MISKFRRTACVCLTGVMTLSLAASSVLAFAKDKSGQGNPARLDTVNFENITGKLDLTSVALNNLSASVLENAGFKVKDETRTVIVTLDDDCILDSVPDGESVAEYLNSYSGSKALRKIDTAQENFLNTLASSGVQYSVVYKYSNVTNAVAIKVNTKYLSKIKSISSVKSAVVSETYARPKEAEVTEATGTENYSNIYPTGIYDSSKYVAQGYDGRGMTVAILDTGLDYTHDAFQKMPPKETLGIKKEKLNEVSSALQAVQLSAQKGDEITGSDLYVNDKVPFAYDYADKDPDVYPAYSQHGVHVAGIVAGDADKYKDKEGNERENFKGVAPNAQLAIFKVFTDDFESQDLGGALTEDIIAALNDCAAIGVDVINMSLGTTAGFSSLYIDGDDEGLALAGIYDRLQERGISVICAASNDFSAGFGSATGTNLATNPDSGTVGSPSTFNGSLSVASVNGQYSPFIVANGKSVIYYQDSSDGNGERNNFVKQMLGNKSSAKFKYVVVGSYGQAGGYTSAVRNELNNKEGYDKVIAIVSRGRNTFEQKVEIAQRMGADAIIIYNNVAGTIGMSIGDLDDPIPAISVTKDAGDLLCYEGNRQLSTGVIEMSSAYQAGPFMNDYSSWGTTPDLKIKPEITSHGGEITSAVSGGYAEMSGTSMATPNLAGFVALLRGKLQAEHPDWDAIKLTNRVNQILMSTAITVLDQDGDPYSPRKQGAGLATLDNVFNTKAYLYTEKGENNYSLDGGKTVVDVEDGRPKIELGHFAFEESETLTFHIGNEFGNTPVSFKPQAIVMTETLSSDGLSVAEKAHIFDDCTVIWKVNGAVVPEDGLITVNHGENATVECTITLSSADKKYINDRFKNGMFVEGFIKLLSDTSDKELTDASYQCDLTLPFMGFFGDWYKAPMLDYDCFEIAEDQKNSSKEEWEKLQPQVWATQAYATYYHEKYTVPLGNFMYLQDETKEQIYSEAEHVAVSCWDEYYGENDSRNYLASYKIKALYAGLLRSAEIVTYDLYDDTTGEIIKSDCIYRVAKSYSSGGSAVPSNVKMELSPEELGLVNNGKYRLDFHFFFKAEDRDNPEKITADNTYSMTFYVDYEAPVLQDARIRYYDYKENNRDKQRVYLDLDIFDNHYAQAVVLCYADKESITNPEEELFLATEYVTPVYNANKNGVTTVSIEITDFYEKYSNRLYLQIDDYALNHSVWSVNFSASQSANLPNSFSVVCNDTVKEYSGRNYDYEMTIGVNEAYKVALNYETSANISNFVWDTSDWLVADVRNGEIFGAGAGDTVITVTGAENVKKKILVHVVDNGTNLSYPNISFGVIENKDRNLVKAQGMVEVNAGQDIKLEIQSDPWYYPLSKLDIVWELTRESDSDVATLEQSGKVKTSATVKTLDKKGLAYIKATIAGTSISATVSLSVQEPFTISGGTLTDYHGTGGAVEIPNDKNVMTIAENAFKDNDNITSIIIPKTVTQINERAFINSTALREVYFISKEPYKNDAGIHVKEAAISLILKNAFQGCSSLEKVDFTNVKKLTVDSEVFAGCKNLKTIVAMDAIGTMNRNAFKGCTALTSVDITGLHNTGSGVFEDCTALETITTDYYSSIGNGMFRGCTALTEVTINAPVVSDNAFAGCSNLKKVIFDGQHNNNGNVSEFSVGARAFYGCKGLVTVEGGNRITNLGNYAFADCEKLTSIEINPDAVHGYGVFDGTPQTSLDDADEFGAIYSGTTLLLAPANIASDFTIKQGTTEIAPYAFAGSKFASGMTLEIPDSVTKIGAGAFNRSTVTRVTLPSSLTKIPEYAFANSSLERITVPASVTSIGERAFASSRLTEITFANSGSREALDLGYMAFLNCTQLRSITLPNLVERDGEVILTDMTFPGCRALTSVNLANVTVIGEAAFGGIQFWDGMQYTQYSGCTSLNNVNLSNVRVIGVGAFGSCYSLSNVTGLGNVEIIGAYAFNGARLNSIDISSAVSVGEYAFYGNSATTIEIPAKLVGATENGTSLPALGAGAFAYSRNLTAFTVNAGNPEFFVEDGVLYRIISGTQADGEYEICAFPAGKTLSGNKIYKIKEGTVSVQGYAFTYLATGAINEVQIPYSVKAIGDGAFYQSGITSYVFESINAPVLQTQTYDVTEITGTLYSLYYTNFEDEFINHAPVVDSRTDSRLKISYPTNGLGYDNYIYTYAFGTVTLLGEYMNDNTRAVKKAIESFAYSASDIAGWNRNNTDFATVKAFSDAVKAVHASYNNISGETQLGFLGEENIQKLFDIESALKPVKQLFGILVRISAIEVSADSTHKTDYKVGEKFDMTGLKLIVTYDDYSTELADMSKATLATGYDGELTTLNRYVILNYNNEQVEVRVNVTPGDGSGPNPNGNPKAKINPAVIYGPIIGVVALAGIAVGVYFLLKNRKAKKSAADTTSGGVEE